MGGEVMRGIVPPPSSSRIQTPIFPLGFLHFANKEAEKPKSHENHPHNHNQAEQAVIGGEKIDDRLHEYAPVGES
jgi:hypothetical protein